MAEERQEKKCAQCGHEKLRATQFYRTNGNDGYMKMCKDCYNATKRENAQRAQREMERRQQELEEQKQQAREREAERKARRAELTQQHEERSQKQRAFLNAWLVEQKPRPCIACNETKAAVEFGYSLLTQVGDYLLPSQLHQRCKICHEKHQEKNLPPCILCQQGIKRPMSYFQEYALFGDGTRLSLCCQTCEPAFQALPVGHQRFSIRSRINLLFPAPQVIYAEVDPLSQQTRYIGRTGHAKRRHGEHKRDIHQKQPLQRLYDRETAQYIEISWTSRANWMFDLKKQGIEAKQRILLDVQPAAHVIEYERRFILHALQQSWPILNSETVTKEAITTKASTLDFLHAPFEELVSAGWFSNHGMEAFIRAWYTP